MALACNHKSVSVGKGIYVRSTTTDIFSVLSQSFLCQGIDITYTLPFPIVLAQYSKLALASKSILLTGCIAKFISM